MPTRARAVTSEDLGAWLVKANPALTDVPAMLRTGFATVERWCVRPSYRTALVVPGTPVLLWVSGGSGEVPSGVYAQGEVTAPVRPREDGAETDDLPLRLRPLDPPVPRDRLAADPDLAGLEVLRSPWGSNPSYLSREQLAALRRIVGSAH